MPSAQPPRSTLRLRRHIEWRLARLAATAAERITLAITGLAMVIAAVVILATSGCFLLTFTVSVLRLIMPEWAAMLITAVLLAGLGAVLAAIATRLLVRSRRRRTRRSRRGSETRS